jgi:hypothetical protein
MDNGAKRALIPIENKRTFLEVSADIMEHVDPIFFGDPKVAAMKALDSSRRDALMAKAEATVEELVGMIERGELPDIAAYKDFLAARRVFVSKRLNQFFEDSRT